MKHYVYILIIFCWGGCSTNPSQAPSPSLLRVVLNGSEIASLDPALMQTDSGSYRIGFQIYDRLAIEKKRNQFVPSSIVANIKQVSSTRIQFFLKENIVFHDGSILNAADVAFSLNRAKNSPFVQQFFSLIKKVEEINPFVVEIETFFPTQHLLEFLSQVPASIVNKTVVESQPNTWALKPIGSGSFKFKEWKLNQYLRLERFYDNDNNKKILNDKQSIKKLEFLWIPHEYSRYLALKTKKVDLIYDIDPFIAQTILNHKEANIKLHSQPSLTLNYLGINNRSPLFKKKEYRHLLFNLLDRNQMTKAAYGNLARVVYNFNSPLTLSENILPHHSNIKNLDPKYLAITQRPLKLITVSDSKRLMMATNLQDQLLKYGITVHIVRADWGNLMQIIKTGDFDLLIYPEAGRFIFPLYFYKTLYSSKENRSNMIYFDNKSVNLLLNDLQSAFSLKEEILVLKKINLLLKKEMPLIPLNFPNQLIAYEEKIQNLENLEHHIIDFSALKLL